MDSTNSRRFRVSSFLSSKVSFLIILVVIVLLGGGIWYVLHPGDSTEVAATDADYQVEIPANPVPNQQVISFKAGTSDKDKEKYLDSIGAKVISEISKLNTVVVEVADENQATPNSKFVTKNEPNYYVSLLADETNPDDPRYSEQWALSAVKAPEVWAQEDSKKEKLVAVVDSGACLNHPDLEGKYIPGWNFIDKNTDVNDTLGHGCEVSGIVAANINNKIGIAGSAKNVKILPLKVLDGQGIGTYADVAAAIVYAVDNKADVINLSLGGESRSDILENAVKYAIKKKVTVVAAAGNSAAAFSLYPAAYKDVISVGAIDSKLVRTTFSNYGDSVDVFAPGQDILTTALGGEYKKVNGTSFAAPFVSAMGISNIVAISPKQADPVIVETPTNSDSQTVTKLEDGLELISKNGAKILKIDWKKYRFEVVVGENNYDGGRESIGSIVNKYNAVGGINTDYFDARPGKTTPPQGTTKINGGAVRDWASTHRDNDYWQDSRTCIRSSIGIPENGPPVIGFCRNEFNVTGGGPWYLKNNNFEWTLSQNNVGKGLINTEFFPDAAGWRTTVDAQSSVGITSDSNYILLGTVSGDDTQNTGLSSEQMALAMKSAGAYNAMRLDSGSSAQLYYKGQYLAGSGAPVAAGLIFFSRHDCNTINAGEKIRIFKDTDCKGESYHVNLSHKDILNLKDHQPSYDDQIKSIRVNPGWSVRVYQHYADYGPHSSDLDPGQWKCITTSAWNLGQDRFTTKYKFATWFERTFQNKKDEIVSFTGETIAGQISSLQVFHNSDCSNNEISSVPNQCSVNTTAAKSGVSSKGLCDGGGVPANTSGCPAGQNGLYCGGTALVGGQSGVLYRCTNGSYSVESTCGNGCLQMPQGTADKCAPGGTDYCKTVAWGGSGNYCKGDNLVTCSPSKTTTKEVACNFGCQTNALFTPDACKTSASGSSVSSNETVKFYGDSEFNPSSLRIQLGEAKSNEPSAGTMYKSVKLPSGWSLKVYSAENQQGDSACWSDSQGLVENTGWHNKIESIEAFSTNVCPSNTPEGPTWKAYFYDGDSKWWDRDIPQNTARCSNKIEGDMLSKDFAGGSPCGGGPLSAADASGGDNWTAEFIANRYFPTDNYVFKIKSDDGVQMFIDGKQKAIRSSQGDGAICPEFKLSGNTELKFILREDSGDSKIDVSWSTDLAACKDVTPPKGTMKSPDKNLHNNSSETVTLEAEAFDQVDTGQNTTGISKIEFYAKSNVWNNNQLTLVGTASANPYKYQWSTAGVPEGIYFITAKVYDGEGNASNFLGDENYWTNITVDRTKPTANVSEVNVGNSFQFNVNWSGQDNLSGNSDLNYDVDFQINCDGSWSNWVGFRSGTSRTFLGRPGESYCFRARAIDLAGNTGNWSDKSNKVTLPTCDDNQYTAEYFDNSTLNGNPIGTQCENSVNHDWGNGGTGFVSTSKVFGDGGDGALVISANTDDNPTDSVINATSGTKSVSADNANFRAGQKILLYQVKGTNAGKHEIQEIDNYDSTAKIITTKESLVNSYASGGVNAAQVIVIRQYTDVTVNEGVTWKAKDWNGQTGGLLIFLATGKTDIKGTIDATGKGFRGGRSGANPNPFADNTNGEQGENISGVQQRTTAKAANGGGGGAPRDPNGEGNGGGGGANGTSGQEGGRHISTSGSVGQGGDPVGSNAQTLLMLGGGGGGGGFGDAEYTDITGFGNGGDGGGLILIKSATVEVATTTGSVISRGITGQAGTHDIGGAGAGGGGSIIFFTKNANLASQRVNAIANNQNPGGTSGGGGRGGEGRITVNYYETVTGQSTPGAHQVKQMDGSDEFSVRWTGKLNVTPNRYRFKTAADDGVRVWINGNSLIDDWTDGFSARTASTFLDNSIDIKVEYYELTGEAKINMEILPDSNRAPIIESIPDQVSGSTQQFQDIDLTNYVNDPDDDYIFWSVVNGDNVKVTVDQAGKAKITKPAGWSGSETLEFTATDEWGDSNKRQVVFTSTVNAAPSFTSTPIKTIAEQTDYNYQVTATDPDGNALSFSLKNGPSGLTVSDNGLVHWPSDKTKIGSHEITIVVNDGANIVEQEYSLTVTNTPSAPVLYEISGQSITQGHTFAAVELDEYVQDNDSNETFSWSITGNENINVELLNDIAFFTYDEAWAGSEELTFTVKDSDNLTASTKAVFTVQPPYPCALGSYQAQYFNNRNLTGEPVATECVGQINNNWGLGSPRPGINSNNFSVRWLGYFDLPAADYLFETTSDDGMRAWVDNTRIFNDWQDHSAKDSNTTLAVSAGIHKITVEYYENGGQSVAKFSFRENPKCSYKDGVFCVEYYSNRTGSGAPKVKTSESKIDHDWGTSAPISGIPADNFFVRWQGNIDFAAGKHVFTTTSDDGVRLWIDDKLVINNWNDHSQTLNNYVANLTAGKHKVKLEYYERTRHAVIKLNWKTLAECSNAAGKFCAEYFGNTKLSGSPIAISEVDAIDFNWQTGSPANEVPANKFSARWSGKFNFAVGDYYLNTLSDDGIRVWIDGKQVINDWKDHSVKETVKPFKITSAGEKQVRVEYYENQGNAVAKVTWQSKQQCQIGIGKFCAEYFNNVNFTGNPALIRDETSINYNWRDQSPAAEVNSNNFAVRWQGEFEFTKGNYTFTTRGDDGIRLWVDGKLVINDWRDHSVKTNSKKVNLSAGKHTIRMEYYEHLGQAVVQLNWAK